MRMAPLTEDLSRSLEVPCWRVTDMQVQRCSNPLMVKLHDKRDDHPRRVEIEPISGVCLRRWSQWLQPICGMCNSWAPRTWIGGGVTRKFQITTNHDELGNRGE